jgi:thioredoxin 1
MKAKEFDKITFEAAVATGDLLLVDFYTTRCTPCVKMSSIIDKLAETYNVGKINADDCMEVFTTYKVSSVPTLIWFKNKKEVKRLMGIQAEEKLVSIFNEL